MAHFKYILYFIVLLTFFSCQSPNINNKELTKLTSEKDIVTKFKTYIDASDNISVAVMPIPHTTNISENKINYFRKIINDNLEYKGYSVIDLTKLDLALKEYGLKNKTANRKIDNLKLRELTSADLLLYGIIKEKIVDGKISYSGSILIHNLNQEKVWSVFSSVELNKEEGVSPLNIAIDYVTSGGVNTLGLVFDFISGVNEEYETLDSFADQMLHTLPNGPNEILLKEEPLLEQATSITIKER
jgi:hypothetical protein